jgi:hypothetical protein
VSRPGAFTICVTQQHRYGWQQARTRRWFRERAGHATAAMMMDLYGHMVDANLWQAARLVGGTTGASEPPERAVRTDSELGIGTKALRSWAFAIEPPIGIEPMTYAL